MSKPENHVTRALAALRGGGPTVHFVPELSESLVSSLERTYPPRCLSSDETVESHLRYAGKVELVASLRLQLDAIRESQQEDVVSTDDEVDDTLTTDAERAS